MQKIVFGRVIAIWLFTLSLAACTEKPKEAVDLKTETELEQPDRQQDVETFHLENFALSHTEIGAFPYLALPSGYEKKQAISLPLNRVPYWVGTQIEWVEGQFFSTGIQAHKDNAQGSFLEIQKAISQQIKMFGGHEVSLSKLSKEQLQHYPKDFLSTYYYGMGNVYQYPAQVFVIRQPQQTIWIQLTQNDDQSAGLLITQVSDRKIDVITADSFPYIKFPTQYHYVHESKKAQTSAPIWNGHSWQWIEGQFFATGIEPKEKGLGSRLELTRYFQAAMKDIGAEPYAKSLIKKEQISPDMKQFMSDYYHATRGIYSSELQVFKREEQGKNIWFVYAETSGEDAGLWVIEEKGHDVNIGPLLANDLKDQLDENNRVNIQIHFDSNEAKILPISKAQIDQVYALLTQDPKLKLHVNGHTDTTGVAQTNLKLSEQRAHAVVQALIELGIEPSRLLAKGFGGTQPIATNSTVEGKAQNRRVELVKQPE